MVDRAAARDAREGFVAPGMTGETRDVREAARFLRDGFPFRAAASLASGERLALGSGGSSGSAIAEPFPGIYKVDNEGIKVE